MDARITRRSLLAGGAGALAAGLIRPSGAGAAPAAPAQTRLRDLPVGELGPGGVTIELPEIADLVGLQWPGDPAARVRLRFRASGGRWSPWASASSHGHGPESASAAQVTGEPIWAGGASAVQITAAEPLHGVHLHMVDVSGGLGARNSAHEAAALPISPPVLQAGAGQPAIIARRGWALGISPPSVAPEYGAVRMAFVHHTENPNGYGAAEVPAMLRAIYAFHRFTNGWDDIGYNFVIDLYGRIFEARAGGITEAVIGAHAGGFNAYSTGVSVLGTFSSTPISTAARHALESLLSWKLPLHGAPAEGRVNVRVTPGGAHWSKFRANQRVSLPRIAGHRDGDSTICPGDALYAQLPAIRPAVRRRAARAATAQCTIALGAAAPATSPATAGGPEAPPPPAPAVPAPAQRPLTGTLTLLDGTPVAGAPVIVQARTVSRRGEVVSERTIAEVLSDGAGHWAATVTVPEPKTPALALRAVFPGSAAAGGCVSEGVRVPAAVS